MQRSLRLPGIALAAAMAVTACSGSGARRSDDRVADQPVASGTGGVTTTVRRLVTPDGRTRTYRLAVPRSVGRDPVPLVLAFHGGFGSGAQFERSSGFSGLAAKDGFVAVYPDGISMGDRVSSPIRSVEHFATEDDCETRRRRTDPDNPDVRTETWTDCRDDTALEFVRVEGANHAWMGRRQERASRRRIGDHYEDFDSTAAIWDFLAAHPRAG